MSDEQPEPPRKPSGIDVIGYLVAVAILLPLGWWVKAHYAEAMGRWTLSLFGH